MLSTCLLRRLVHPRNLVFSSRGLSSVDENTTKAKNYENKLDRELEDALKIEASLFDNSTISHDPVKVSEALKKTKKTGSPKKTQTPVTKTKNIKMKSPEFMKINQSFKPKAKESEAVIKDASLGLEFIRLSLGDRKLATLMTKVRSRKRRDKDREIIIEGRRLIEEALDCGLVLESLIFSKAEEVERMKDKLAVAQKKYQTEVFLVRHHDLKTWSALTTPPGLMAIFSRPSEMEQVLSKDTALPITVICDNIREPNNLGSIIRTCASLPCKQVVVTKGCCDPWESKALRGGCGGHFRLIIKDDIEWSEISSIISPEDTENCHIFVAENNLEKISTLPKTSVVNYADVEQLGTHNIVIIGGESHGVSSEAYKLMSLVGPQRGKCVYIPLASGIDSLNVVSALTLILFELRKHVFDKKIVANTVTEEKM